MIKKHLIFSLLTVLIFTKNTFSQTINTDKRFPPIPYESIPLDQTLNNITYKYYYIENLKTKEKKSSLTILEIGERYSKFSDVYTLKQDSLQKVFSELESLGSKEINLFIPLINKVGLKKDVIKNFQDNLITFQGKVHSIKYEYEEEIPCLNWQLTDVTKTILDYKVKKAITNYGGRKWIAWFTEAIPINSGPYIFGDLPGLILELYDNEKSFHFIAIGMDNEQNEIYKRVGGRIVKTSKKNFFKVDRNFHEHPELFVKQSIIGGIKLEKKPYNPIEFTNE